MSLCPIARSQNKQVLEEKKGNSDYIAEEPHKKNANFKEDQVKQKIRKNLMDAGYSQTTVDDVMKNVQSLPETLVQAYYDML